jgi:hypothetical protein
LIGVNCPIQPNQFRKIHGIIVSNDWTPAANSVKVNLTKVSQGMEAHLRYIDALTVINIHRGGSKARMPHPVSAR